ncbi:MAG: hypothetical protein B7Z16_08375 [Algoriphagus sp. 32-45-6]|nr:MAG: hypothetical protein B7Z16_08375 [Algoriphagus sp. 32-45-6]
MILLVDHKAIDEFLSVRKENNYFHPFQHPVIYPALIYILLLNEHARVNDTNRHSFEAKMLKDNEIKQNYGYE